MTCAAVLAFGARECASGLAEDMAAAYAKQIRALDGEQFLEDEPIWPCVSDAAGVAEPDAWGFPAWVLVSPDKSRRLVAPYYPITYHSDGNGHLLVPRGFELSQSFGITDPTRRYPLIGGYGNSGLPQGVWNIRTLRGDTTLVLAQIRVIEPRGSERSVRDGLARAARLAFKPEGSARAAALYESIVQRYPRTAYLSVIYWGEWKVREHTRYAHDPGRWMEEIFARFHDTCFGVVALDRWVNDMGVENARPTLRTLVGLYPDTPLSRAAQRYLQPL